MESRSIGQACELRVVRALLAGGFQILQTNWRTMFAEADILAQRAPQEFFIVEVKSLSDYQWSNHRISWKQVARLRRLQLHCNSCLGPTRLIFAFVSPRWEITWIPDDGTID